MNILLDAFYDLNYGDDLFVETATRLFPHCKFYSFLEHYPESVIAGAEKYPNLYLLPECDVFLRKNMFDGYLCVGGDIFPDGGDFTKRKKYIASVKQAGGPVIFWGFSLFDSYSPQTRQDLAEMMSQADVIAPRDKRSAQYLQALLPEKEITPVADLAFLSQWTAAQKCARLGVSVRRPNYATDEDMLRYTADLQDTINTYLAGDATREVVLFSLSVGNTSDTDVVEAILDRVEDEARVRHIVYSGDTASVKQEIAGCELVICTRLHAMISCIAMNVPFIPIVYEVKMEHILQDIGYQRQVVHFNDTRSLVAQVLGVLAENAEPVQINDYISPTVAAKEKVQSYLGNINQDPIVKEDTTGPVCLREMQLRDTFGTALRQREQDVETLEAALQQRNGDVTTLEEALRAANEHNHQMAQRIAHLENTLPMRICRGVKRVFKR